MDTKGFSVRGRSMLIPALALFCLLLSCAPSGRDPAGKSAVHGLSSPAGEKTVAAPLAILQTGEYPLWFQLTEKGPVLLESIEDARYSAALVPWPLALHIRFFLARGDELLMAINRDGFMKLAPYSNTVTGLGLYRFSGNEFWRQYTVGGFVFFADNPVALLYLDTRFLDSGSPLPNPRTWTFSMESNTPFPLAIPALELFPADEGWDADSLRSGPDGLWYYRVRKDEPAPEVRTLRTADLAAPGEDVSLDDFQNSVLREPELPQSLSLPPLPEGFVYTWVGMAGDSLFASWEEQEDYNTGAAGFMVIKPAFLKP
jgi:hypothetical protein